MKQTPFYQEYLKAKAKIVEFAGFSMPVEFSGVLNEVKASRVSCGLFDATHMGQIWLKGEKAFDFLQKLTSNDISHISTGQLQYNLLINETGGIIDDLMVYNLGKDFLCVVNASNHKKVIDWLNKNNSSKVEIDDLSQKRFLLSLQGPTSCALLKRVFAFEVESIQYMHFVEQEIMGAKLLISRSGYTGEDGFEIYGNKEDAAKIWDILLKSKEEFGLALCGLGSRDVLRIEAGYPLYGHEIDDSINPLEAVLSWAVKFDKDFIGKKSLLKIKEVGLKRKRIGLIMDERVVPRQGYKIFYQNKPCGVVTSGAYSPNIASSIGMGYIDKEIAALEIEVDLEIRNKFYKAKIAKLPFVGIHTKREKVKNV